MKIPPTMMQLQLAAPRTPVWQEVPVPAPGPGEVLMRVIGVTTCPHWDLHLFDGRPMFPGQSLVYPYLPGQPGHEAMGEVAALGPGVKHLRVGQRVVAWRDTGKPRMGFYGQYNTFAEADLLAVPDKLPPAEIASLELAMCVEVSFQRLRAVGNLAGRRVGVAGLGPAGLVAVQLALAHGAAEVIGIDPLAARGELALTLGASRVVTPDVTAWPAGRRGEPALDYALDCTGRSGSVEFLLDRTREAVALFGVLREEVRYAPHHMWGPGVTLLGYGDHNRAAAESALALILADRLRLAPLVTHTLSLQRYAEGVELLRRQEAIKVLFDPWS